MLVVSNQTHNTTVLQVFMDTERSMTSGEQCMTRTGTVLMPVWSAGNWVMQPLEVSGNAYLRNLNIFTSRILGSACMTTVRTEENQHGQLAVTFFISFSGSVLDSDTAVVSTSQIFSAGWDNRWCL